MPEVNARQIPGKTEYLRFLVNQLLEEGVELELPPKNENSPETKRPDRMSKAELFQVLTKHDPTIKDHLKELWPYQGSRCFMVYQPSGIDFSIVDEKYREAVEPNVHGVSEDTSISELLGMTPDNEHEKYIQFIKYHFKPNSIKVVGMFPDQFIVIGRFGESRYEVKYKKFNILISREPFFCMCDLSNPHSDKAIQALFRRNMFRTLENNKRLICTEQESAERLDRALWVMVRGKYSQAGYNGNFDEIELTARELVVDDDSPEFFKAQAECANLKRGYEMTITHSNGFVEEFAFILTYKDQSTKITFKGSTSSIAISTLVETLFLEN